MPMLNARAAVVTVPMIWVAAADSVGAAVVAAAETVGAACVTAAATVGETATTVGATWVAAAATVGAAWVATAATVGALGAPAGAHATSNMATAMTTPNVLDTVLTRNSLPVEWLSGSAITRRRRALRDVRRGS